MKLPFGKGVWWKSTLSVPATAGLRDLFGREKGAMTADEALFGAKPRRSGCLPRAILSRLVFFPDFAFMADMSQWQGKSQKRHNLDGFAMMCRPLRRQALRQALVNPMRASMRHVFCRTARFPRV
ncbi:hypothetical protein [Shinella sp. M31]|uniref:hypothetical protein n=1 Tax=Shinella sp. M31 TaxID=3368615 RepID=UPI003B9E9F46